MAKTTSTLARDVFLYLLATVTLVAIAVSSMSLLFQYVNYFFPDAAIYSNVTETLKVVLSILIIFTPVYVWVNRFLNRDLQAHPAKHGLAIRRWLVHLTLFASGLTIMIDLVTLIYNFLGGELTTRFALKVLSVLVVAAVVFTYYIWDLKREAKNVPAKMLWLGRIALAALAAFVVGGFFLVESPADQRAARLDQERVNDLWELQSMVEGYYLENEALPESLTALDRTVPMDPASNEAYGYTLLSQDSYELCATFAFDSGTNPYVRRTVLEPGVTERDFYSYEQGEDCFERSVENLK